MNMTTKFETKSIPYTGLELRPHYILSQFQIEDSALIAFCGECDVKTDHLVDWEDRLSDQIIFAKEMLHFLGEFFGITLKEGIWIQRLIVSELKSILNENNILVTRDGDDLFYFDQKLNLKKKLTVSIVTASPVSILFHLGVNIDPTGAPVDAIGLNHFLSRNQILEVIQELMYRFQKEYHSVQRASVKVRSVI